MTVLDIKRPSIYGRIRRRLCIKLPEQGPMSKHQDMTGRLLDAGGIGEAPQMWPEERGPQERDSRSAPRRKDR